jgi:hypothetical protein
MYVTTDVKIITAEIKKDTTWYYASFYGPLWCPVCILLAPFMRVLDVCGSVLLAIQQSTNACLEN